MIPRVIKDATHKLGKDQPGLLVLHVRAVDGLLQSVWEPSEDERKRLSAGALVRLEIMGNRHPPVRLCVEPAPETVMPLSPSVCPLCRSRASTVPKPVRDALAAMREALAMLEQMDKEHPSIAPSRAIHRLRLKSWALKLKEAEDAL